MWEKIRTTYLTNRDYSKSARRDKFLAKNKGSKGRKKYPHHSSFTDQLSIDQQKQQEEEIRSPSAWSQLPKSKKRRKNKNCRKSKKKPISIEKRRRKVIFKEWECVWLDIVRKSKRYKVWRERILERDNHICQLKSCRHTCKQLHVHHKQSARMFPDLIFDDDNGITYCKDCHENLHISRYDKRQTRNK